MSRRTPSTGSCFECMQPFRSVKKASPDQGSVNLLRIKEMSDPQDTRRLAETCTDYITHEAPHTLLPPHAIDNHHFTDLQIRVMACSSLSAKAHRCTGDHWVEMLTIILIKL